MGDKRIGVIQNRMFPDINLFTKQKKLSIVIKRENNDCLLKALAIGIIIAEKPSQKNQTKTLKP